MFKMFKIKPKPKSVESVPDRDYLHLREVLMEIEDDIYTELISRTNLTDRIVCIGPTLQTFNNYLYLINSELTKGSRISSHPIMTGRLYNLLFVDNRFPLNASIMIKWKSNALSFLTHYEKNDAVQNRTALESVYRTVYNTATELTRLAYSK